MNSRLQTFVAGAVAVIGFRGLFWVPHGFAARDSVYILAGLMIGMGLPLGIAILRGRREAVRLAEIYLAMGVLGMSAALGASKLGFSSPTAPALTWGSLSDVLAPALLLVLLLWSRTQRGEKNFEAGGSPGSPPPQG